ncbi:MAG: tRNA (N6-isopentenyl adenosine(37)-C2)-methylthiotransferase MiaB [Spirochaetia bacterium]|nr:tRNA (N6-isopentenyl adenosine(37)-C2)-methylthiotransferase MiaB [Spirochaetia bacterium]
MNQVQNKKKFFIETYGCQMNEYDSLIAQNILEKENTEKAPSIESADIILLNTCAVRENAQQKVYNRLRSIIHLKKKGAKIGILGCMAQNVKDELFNEKISVDFVIGPDSLNALPDILQESNEKIKLVKLSKTELYENHIPDITHHLKDEKSLSTAYVAIQRGCDNFCSFCIVPYTRGRERSRNPDLIIKEINNLTEGGIKSVILLGQNVNSYNYKEINFHHLIENILMNTNLERIYFTSPHPKDFPLELIDLMAKEKRFISMIHLPLQSGSNKILKLMKRNYTSEDFLRLTDIIRNKVDDVFISTDVIVGYPSEDETDFLDTLDTMQKANFDAAFMFAYSERMGTHASQNHKDNVSLEEKQKRLEEIIKQQLERSSKKNNLYINKTVEVMIEDFSRKNKNELSGRMLNGRKVVFSMPEKLKNKPIELIIGSSVNVLIEKTTSSTLLGKSFD